MHWEAGSYIGLQEKPTAVLIHTCRPRDELTHSIVEGINDRVKDSRESVKEGEK